MKVLLVQTGGPTVALLGALSRYGHRIVVGGGAQAALELAGRVPIRALVADFHLPDRTGVWLLSQFREQFPEVQRVLTADEPRLDLDRLVANGTCHAALRVPYRPGALLDVLAGVPSRTDQDDTPIVTPELPAFV